MQLVIDTHIWLWWATRDPRHPDLITHLNMLGAGKVDLSVISPWEVALKHRKGGDVGIEMAMPLDQWLDMALRPQPSRVLPLTIEIALIAVDLSPPVPADPADRFIMATALAQGVPLLTRDEKLLAYGGVEHYVF